jgi:ATP-dependent Clp protease ATP-binding subunit ClpC
VYPFERFTESARLALIRARDEAVAANQPFIGTEHVALALAGDDGVAGRVLRDLGLTDEGMRARIAVVLESGERQRAAGVIPTSRMKRVTEVAFQEATSAGAEQVGTEHLLVALLVEAEGVAARALEDLGATLPRVRRAIRAGLGNGAAASAGIVDAVTLEQAFSDTPVPGASVGTSSSLAAALMRAGQLAREEGAADIRADHLIRAIATMAVSGTADLRGTLDKLGLEPEATVRALTVPEEIRRLGLAAQRARVAQGPAYDAGGEAASRAVRETLRLGREYTEAVSRWLAESSG